MMMCLHVKRGQSPWAGSLHHLSAGAAGRGVSKEHLGTGRGGRGHAGWAWGAGSQRVGYGSLAGRVAQMRRRLACPGPVLGGDRLFPAAVGEGLTGGVRGRACCLGRGGLLDLSHKPNQIVGHVYLLHDGKVGETHLYRENLYLDSSFTHLAVVSSGVMDLNIKAALLRLPEEKT